MGGRDHCRFAHGGRLTAVKTRFMVAAVLSLVPVAACGESASTLCDAPVSLAGFVVGFDQQLANFDSDQSAGLQPETLEVLAQAELLAGDESVDTRTRAVARRFAELVGRFARSMDDVLWDLPTALANDATLELVSTIGSSTTLADANLLESVVIEKCGLPPLVPVDSAVVATLPMPSIPSPTDTEPPVNTVNEESEARALGTTIGELFSLTLTDAQTVCLGSALSGVYDQTGASSTDEQYLRQFQDGFDRCGIEFTVPVD